ncbi:transcriptional regulator [Streptomyces sp. NPDC058293]|uniref:transcriptional regulator n=1 Tax=unclassified Streptomyces TaxID=2593676 RepID=UPI00225BAB0C|nr:MULTISPECIES: transcriptional regulator [unclassified Streptomyces]MCX4645219.1 transcriptional regulator [Streptomyces sp. NBC_01446]MCX5326013.1 transcriptional regulator [Streptomyces sp. NBC_00120]
MNNEFGNPPLAAENRGTVERRLKEATAGDGPRETLTVEWRTKPKVVEVIDMPVHSLYLNPATHRIRAQRSYKPEADSRLDEEPWSPESQEYLMYLLQAKPDDPSKFDPAFAELKANLQEFGQNEPGLITRDGILVNGNTRAAALRKLGVPNIRVGVLPDSCTWADINAVELSLQLRQDKRRDYSYINELIAMQEQMDSGRQISDIAKAFHKRVPTVEADLWILARLEELRIRSRADGAQLQLLYFEDAKEKLHELYRAWTKDSKKNRDRADLMMEYRIAAIALKFSKTDVRLIDSEFWRRYLEPRLAPALRPDVSESEERRIPGMKRVVKPVAAPYAEAKALTDQILQATALERSGTEAASEASKKVKQVREAFDEALEPAGKDSRVRKRSLAASDRINDACQDIEQCIIDIGLARASNSLDEETLDDSVLRLKATLGKLAREVNRSIGDPGDGVAWLLDAVSKEQA